MTSLLTTAPSNVVGSTVTPSVATPGATSSTTAQKSSASKARLLFNSDGSVKLLGDPSFFPGSGIDGNSHTLVPTIGPDGKMTMLLTPADGLGKTFILSPTNGASLPNPQTLLNTSPNPNPPIGTTKSTALPFMVQGTTGVRNPLIQTSEYNKKVTTSVDNIKHRPPVPTPGEQKRTIWPSQKSLLTGLNGKSSINNSQFATHMRIDPSGSSTSTVRIALPPSHSSGSTTYHHVADASCASKNMFGSTVLKNIADKLKPTDRNQKQLVPPLAGLFEKPGTQVIAVNPDKSQTHIYTTKGSSEACLVDHKYVTASNNQWTRLSSSVMPSNPSSKNPTAVFHPKGDNKHNHLYTPPINLAPKSDVSNNFIMIPSVTPVSCTKGPGTYTVIFAHPPAQGAPQIAQTSSASSVCGAAPLVIYGQNNVSSFGNKNASTTLSTAGLVPTTSIPNSTFTNTTSLLSSRASQTQVVFPPSTGSKPMRFVIKNGQLTPVPKKQTILQTTNSSSSSSTSSSSSSEKLIVKLPTVTKQSKTGNIALNAVGGRFIQKDMGANRDSCVEIKESIESILDPVTGCLDTDKTDTSNPEPEEDIMSIKIDSVFSLSTKDTNEDTLPEIFVKREIVDSEVVAEKNSEVEFASLEDKPKTITCHPSYVVLEQLSRNQIENPKECIFKCSNYCRVRTLNFLCSLGLVNCKPTEHTINPVKQKEEKNQTSSEKQESTKKKKKRKKCGDTIESEFSGKAAGIKQEKKDEITPPPSESTGSAAGKTTQDQGPGSETSQKVRKVSSPGSPITKVIKFTRVEKEQTDAKPPSVNTSANPMTSKGSTNLGVLSSIYPSTNVSLRAQTQVSSSVGPITVHASKVMQGEAPVQIATNLKSMLPMTKMVASNNKQYFIFSLNGQKILVPSSNDMQKPKAFVLKGNTSSLNPSLSEVPSTNPPTSTAVSSVSKAATPSNGTSKQKRQSDSAPKSQTPNKVARTVSPQVETLPSGIRIKSEPVTHGYGDEEPPKPKKKKKRSGVKVKQEPVDNEWHEIWSSASQPVSYPSAVSDGKRGNITSHSTEDPAAEARTMSDIPPEDDHTMPDLPMMKVPSTKEIAKKTAAHNDRIERLKAMLKEKEKLIEELKMQRVEETELETCDTNDKVLGLTSVATEETPFDSITVTGDTLTDSSKGSLDKTALDDTECNETGNVIM